MEVAEAPADVVPQDLPRLVRHLNAVLVLEEGNGLLRALAITVRAGRTATPRACGCTVSSTRRSSESSRPAWSARSVSSTAPWTVRPAQPCRPVSCFRT